VHKTIIDLDYIDPFDYKFTIIKKVDVFKDYVDTTFIDVLSLRFASHYFRSQWNMNNFQLLFLMQILRWRD
jgi:hypothetical protein